MLLVSFGGTRISRQLHQTFGKGQLERVGPFCLSESYELVDKIIYNKHLSTNININININIKKQTLKKQTLNKKPHISIQKCVAV